MAAALPDNGNLLPVRRTAPLDMLHPLPARKSVLSPTCCPTKSGVPDICPTNFQPMSGSVESRIYMICMCFPFSIIIITLSARHARQETGTRGIFRGASGGLYSLLPKPLKFCRAGREVGQTPREPLNHAGSLLPDNENLCRAAGRKLCQAWNGFGCSSVSGCQRLLPVIRQPEISRFSPYHAENARSSPTRPTGGV